MSLCNISFTQELNNDEIDTTQKFNYVDTAHKPKKAVIFSAILPSAGHIYNQFYKIEGQKNSLWWKLPIIYGGMGAMTYFTIFNQGEYKRFKNERLARLDLNYIPDELSSLSGPQLKVYQDQYERLRNLSVIGGLLFYTLQLIDANVEAHLMHFDSSEDMAFQWNPVLFTGRNTAQFGISLRISFK